MLEHINVTNIIIVILLILLVASFVSSKLTNSTENSGFSKPKLAGLAGLILISIYQVVLAWGDAINTVVLFSLIILLATRFIWLNYNEN